MTARSRLKIAGFVLLVQAGLIPGSAIAHEFTMKSLMNAFVRLEPGHAHLVIRVPLHVLGPTSFPATGRELDLARAGPAIERALTGLGKEIEIRENGRPLVPAAAIGRLTLPSDRSFEGYEEAIAHVARPVDPGTVIYVDQGFLDAHLTYPIVSPASQFTIQTTLAPGFKDYLKLAIRFLPLEGSSRAYVISSASGRVALNPRWDQAASGFVRFGMAHILTGYDHLLFLLCLVIPFRRLRGLLPVITAFTVGHSITLIGSAYDLVPAGAWFPPLVETLIAVSIVYMALENIVKTDFGHRWLIAGMFGLVHGFGFSYGLKQDLQFAGSHILVALLSFNIGIEIGQLLVLLVALPALALLFRYALVGRVGTIILSALVAHTGWHWMMERADVLWKVQWPALDAAGLAVLARWVAGILLVIAAVRLIARRARGVFRRRAPAAS